MANKPDARRAVKLSEKATADLLNIAETQPWLKVLTFNQLVHLAINEGLDSMRSQQAVQRLQRRKPWSAVEIDRQTEGWVNVIKKGKSK